MTIQTANQLLSKGIKEKPANQLFGNFWYENELCFLYSKENAGKSILGMQIAQSIASGESIDDFVIESEPQKVLYFDFELSLKQFAPRYSVEKDKVFTNPFQFSDNLSIINKDNFPKMGEASNMEVLRRFIILSGVKVIVIDNLSFIENNMTAKKASDFMMRLKDLKDKLGLSILMLGHTTKRNPKNPITSNDLQGSKILMNAVDSAFAIGTSIKDSKMRYVKQIKQRNCEQMYGEQNVCVFEIEKPSNFLRFAFVETSTEISHLKEDKDAIDDELINSVIELSCNGISPQNIGKELGITTHKVNKILRENNF